jgi:DNA-binding SARP family transcriptional activator/Tfp pilus assembly protein PilF
MEFRVLGSMSITTERGPVRLAGARQQRLLAALLIDFDEVVSLPRLVDTVWDDDPPATAKRQVQNATSALRRQLVDRDADPPAILVDGLGYRVPASAGWLDARVFAERDATGRQLVAAGQPERARAELRTALGLWRGPAYQGLTGTAIEAAAARLNEQRLAATEECVELELALGRHREVIGELTELVAVYPLRERLVGQLMLALHWSGRTAEASRAYHALRTRLADELALDPSGRLHDLHTAILNDTPAAGPPAGPRPAVVAGTRPLPVPAQLPAGVASFTGRAKDLADLAGAGSICVITGMAGVGKTALAVHWAHQARDRYPDGQLYVNLRGFDPTGRQMNPGEAIRGFLDALSVPPDRIPDDLEAQAALYRSLLAGRRMLVLLDNARDAGQVRPLLPGTASCRVLVTSRHRLSGLVAGEGADPLALDLLAAAEARDLLARRVGRDRVAAEPGGVDEIVARCAGLPLALAIVAARAAAQRELPLAVLADELRADGDRLDAFDGDDPATDVRAVFSWSYQALSPAAARLFRLLALHPGPDISAAAAASLAGRPAGPARPVLSELVAAHLLVEHPPRRYALHDLLRVYATELVQRVENDADRRTAVHRVLDHYLHTGWVAARGQHPQRHPIAVPRPQPEVIPEQPRDRTAAVAWFTAELAVLRNCVIQAVRLGFDRHAWQLAWTVAEFLDQRGQWHEGVALQRRALQAARRADDRMGQAHAHRALGRGYLRLTHTDVAVRHLRAALALFGALDEQVAEARTHLDLGWASDQQGRWEPALDHAQRALDLFRKTSHRPGLADALNAIGSYHALLGDHQQALDVCHRALALHEELGYRRGQAATWVRLGYAHLHLGDHARAAACYRRALDMYQDLDTRYDEGATLVALGDVQEAEGDVSAARDSWRQAYTIFTELRHADAEPVRAKLQRRWAGVARHY